MKHRVDHGVYVLRQHQSAISFSNRFDDQDAEDIKQALVNLFENDSSSARPEGSMEVVSCLVGASKFNR